MEKLENSGKKYCKILHSQFHDNWQILSANEDNVLWAQGPWQLLNAARGEIVFSTQGILFKKNLFLINKCSSAKKYLKIFVI